jgi:hypothetical protein
MAIQVNATLTTTDGFTVNGAFCYVNIYLVNGSWCNLSYFKSEADWAAGKQPINVNLPSRVSLDLTTAQFWAPDAITNIHETCVAEIEATTGSGTCEILQG